VQSALGDISRQQGQLRAARRYYTQAIASYQQVYNERGLLPTQLSQAEMMDHLGHHLAARRAARGAAAPHPPHGHSPAGSPGGPATGPNLAGHGPPRYFGPWPVSP